MHWFKHDSDANQDAKLKRLRMKYGLEGYGLYWYCVELIASEVDHNKFTFELEHDSEIISFDTGIHIERINEMMAYMVNLGLFESNNNTITCLKMLKRLDQSMTSHKGMREMITKAKNNHDSIMISPDEIMKEENRSRIEVDKNKDIVTQRDNDRILVDQVIDMYNTVKATENPNWIGVESKTVDRVAKTKKFIAFAQKRIGSKDHTATLQWFTDYFIALSKDEFYSGRPSFKNRDGFKWKYDSIIRPKNYIDAIERFNDE